MMRYLRIVFKRMVTRLVERNLAFKLTLFLFAALTVPLAFITFLQAGTSQRTVKESVVDANRQIALRAAREIDLIMDRPLAVLQSVSAVLGEVFDSPWRQETVLVEMVLNDPSFIQAAVLDMSGQVIASSELGVRPRFENAAEILKSAAGGKSYISPVGFGEDHTPFTTFACPVKRMGNSIAVLVVDVRMLSLWQTVDAIRLGRTGRAFVVSSDGIVVAHPDKKIVLKNENVSMRKDVALVLAGKSQSLELVDAEGQAVLSSFAPVLSTGWGLIVYQSAQEAYQAAQTASVQAWVIFFLLEVIVFLGCIALARILIMPLQQVMSGIDRAASGDLEHMMRVTRKDEIGKMARVFNSMIVELKKARRREKLSDIGEATAWIVHEFKNSLVSIKPFVQLFPKKHKDEEFVKVFSRLVPEEMDRWERLLGDLGDYVSNSRLNQASVDIKEIIENLLEVAQPACAEKNIELKRSLPVTEVVLFADAERLRQVFLNLIINAMNALPQGGEIAVFLYTLMRDGQDTVVVKIRDNGRGIPADQLKKIFEPFHQTRSGGMGLGLSVCRKIVEQHEGSISIDSKTGRGTTVTVVLPIKTEDQVRFRPDSDRNQKHPVG